MRKYTNSEYIRVMCSAIIRAPWFYTNPERPYHKTREYQFQRIKKLITHAYNTTSFYHGKYKSAGVSPADFTKLEDLIKFPTVTKDEIISHFPQGSLSKKVSQKKCVLSLSSGSSGKVIRILHDPKDTWAYILGRFRILNIEHSYSPLDRTLYIYTSRYPASSFFGLYPAFLISTLNPISDTAEKIRAIRPQIICSYPSLMLELRNYISTEEARDLKLKLISVGSELSSKQQRKDLANHFNCPVYDEYSSEELGWIAGECSHKFHHLWEDISFVEILDPHYDLSRSYEEKGEIVGTNLHNFAMPFIRYRQGDLGIISDKKNCECGKTFRILKEFLGRKNDSFVFASGTTLTSAYLLDVIYSLLLDLKIDILDFCMIQETSNLVRLEILPGKNFQESDVRKIEEKLRSVFPTEVRIDVSSPSQLYKTAAGKRNPIISKLSLGNS